MTAQQVSCFHRGNTFFGAVETSGSGKEMLVRVRYNGEAAEAKLGGFTIDTLAQLLLREQVLEEFASIETSTHWTGRSGSLSIHRAATSS